MGRKAYTSITNGFSVNQNFTAGLTVSNAAINCKAGITNSDSNLILSAKAGSSIVCGVNLHLNGNDITNCDDIDCDDISADILGGNKLNVGASAAYSIHSASLYMNDNTILEINTLSFHDSSNNKISDTSTDLVLQGNSGMQLKLNSSGGIIVDGASVFRPSDNAGTDLGGSSFRWEDAYFETVHEGDVVYEEKVCEVCKKPFKKGDKICLVVLSVKEEGTRCVPAHVNCPG